MTYITVTIPIFLLIFLIIVAFIFMAIIYSHFATKYKAKEQGLVKANRRIHLIKGELISSEARRIRNSFPQYGIGTVSSTLIHQTSRYRDKFGLNERQWHDECKYYAELLFNLGG